MRPAPEVLTLTSEIVSSHVANNSVAGADLSDLITLDGLGAPAVAEPEPQIPAVPIRKSVQDEHLVCLEDGRKLKMLKWRLSTADGTTPDEHRAK